MLFSDIFRLSLRMFKARTLRTVLTILGMGVGIAAIVFLVSLGYGLQDALLERITTSDALSTLDVMPDAEAGGILDTATIQALSEIPGVESVIPVIELRGQIRVGTVTLDSGVAVAPPAFLRLEGAEFASGRAYGETAAEIVITSGVAKAFLKDPRELLDASVDLSLFLPRDAGGISHGMGEDSVPLGTPFTISGIVESDQNRVYVPAGTLRNLALPPASKLKVKGRSTDELPAIRSAVEARSLTASSISETVDQANKVFQALRIILMLFGVIALVVSAIGMFNTMTITLLERTEEIGIMKSIGAAPSSISLMFIMEATIMGLFGSLIGILIGILGGEGVNLLFNVIASRFGGQTADLFSTPIWFLSAIVAFGAFVGFLTGIIPARKAAKTDALEALRYK